MMEQILEWLERRKRVVGIAGLGLLGVLIVAASVNWANSIFSAQVVYLVIFVGIIVGGVMALKFIQKYF